MTEQPASEAAPGVLAISVELVDRDHAVVTLAGRFDAVEAMHVRERLGRDELVGVDHVVFDLTEVDFVDSAGLAALARARRDRVLRDGSVTLVRPRSDEAMRVFRLTQFDEIFTMLDRRSGGSTR